MDALKLKQAEEELKHDQALDEAAKAQGLEVDTPAIREARAAAEHAQKELEAAQAEAQRAREDAQHAAEEAKRSLEDSKNTEAQSEMQAREQFTKEQQRAKELASKANEESEQIVSEAKQRADELKHEAERISAHAAKDSVSIKEQARIDMDAIQEQIIELESELGQIEYSGADAGDLHSRLRELHEKKAEIERNSHEAAANTLKNVEADVQAKHDEAAQLEKDAAEKARHLLEQKKREADEVLATAKQHLEKRILEVHQTEANKEHSGEEDKRKADAALAEAEERLRKFLEEQSLVEERLKEAIASAQNEYVEKIENQESQDLKADETLAEQLDAAKAALAEADHAVHHAQEVLADDIAEEYQVADETKLVIETAENNVAIDEREIKEVQQLEHQIEAELRHLSGEDVHPHHEVPAEYIDPAKYDVPVNPDSILSVLDKQEFHVAAQAVGMPVESVVAVAQAVGMTAEETAEALAREQISGAVIDPEIVEVSKETGLATVELAVVVNSGGLTAKHAAESLLDEKKALFASVSRKFEVDVDAIIALSSASNIQAVEAAKLLNEKDDFPVTDAHRDAARHFGVDPKKVAQVATIADISSAEAAGRLQEARKFVSTASHDASPHKAVELESHEAQLAAHVAGVSVDAIVSVAKAAHISYQEAGRSIVMQSAVHQPADLVQKAVESGIDATLLAAVVAHNMPLQVAADNLKQADQELIEAVAAEHNLSPIELAAIADASGIGLEAAASAAEHSEHVPVTEEAREAASDFGVNPEDVAAVAEAAGVSLEEAARQIAVKEQTTDLASNVVLDQSEYAALDVAASEQEEIMHEVFDAKVVAASQAANVPIVDVMALAQAAHIEPGVAARKLSAAREHHSASAAADSAGSETGVSASAIAVLVDLHAMDFAAAAELLRTKQRAIFETLAARHHVDRITFTAVVLASSLNPEDVIKIVAKESAELDLSGDVRLEAAVHGVPSEQVAHVVQAVGVSAEAAAQAVVRASRILDESAVHSAVVQAEHSETLKRLQEPDVRQLAEEYQVGVEEIVEIMQSTEADPKQAAFTLASVKSSDMPGPIQEAAMDAGINPAMVDAIAQLSGVSPAVAVQLVIQSEHELFQALAEENHVDMVLLTSVAGAVNMDPVKAVSTVQALDEVVVSQEAQGAAAEARVDATTVARVIAATGVAPARAAEAVAHAQALHRRDVTPELDAEQLMKLAKYFYAASSHSQEMHQRLSQLSEANKVAAHSAQISHAALQRKKALEEEYGDIVEAPRFRQLSDLNNMKRMRHLVKSVSAKKAKNQHSMKPTF